MYIQPKDEKNLGFLSGKTLVVFPEAVCGVEFLKHSML